MILRFVTALGILIGHALNASESGLSDQDTFSIPALEDVALELEKIENRTIDTLEHLLTIQNDKKTYENTIQPWCELKDEFLKILNKYKHLTKSPEILDFKDSVWSMLFNTPELENALLACSLRVLEGDNTLDAYQKGIAISLLEIAPTDYIYCEVNASVKFESPDRLTIFSSCVNANFSSKESLSLLALTVLNENPDIICLQEVYTDEAAHTLYNSLKGHYAVFYIANNLNFSSGIFIASKYHLEQPHFTPYSTTNPLSNCGFFDFCILAKNHSLGHLYVASYYPLAATTFPQILQKMEKDFLTEETGTPFILSINSGLTPINLEEGIIFKDHYVEVADYTPSFSAFPSKEDYLITNQILHISSIATDYVLTKIENQSWKDSQIMNGYVFNELAYDQSLICDGSVGISAEGNTNDGTAQIEGNIEYSKETDYGTIEGKGSVSIDNNGDVNGEIRIDYKFNF